MTLAAQRQTDLTAFAAPPAARPESPASRPATALEVENLTVRFGATPVFRNLSFSVPERELLVVIGPNGGGKTVLFRALIGSIPHEGSIRWAQKTRIGYVPQKLDIDRALPVTGKDLLRAKASVVKAPERSLNTAIARVGLPAELLESPIGALSGGQFQEVLLAFALIGEPNVLLLDEPTAGIDAPGTERMYALIRALQAESDLTAILISHDLSIVARYATNVLCIGRGDTWFGPPQSVLDPQLLGRMYGMPIGFHAHESS